MKKKTWAIIASIFVCLTIVRWMYLHAIHEGEVVFTNKATEQIQNAEIEICKQEFTLQDIKPGESRRFLYKVTSDSHYKIIVVFESKREIVKEIGYVTNGLDFNDTLIIEDDDIKLIRNSV